MKHIVIAVVAATIAGATVVAAQSPTRTAPPAPPVPSVAPIAPVPSVPPLPPEPAIWEEVEAPLDVLWLDGDLAGPEVLWLDRGGVDALAPTPEPDDVMAWSPDDGGDLVTVAPRAHRGDRVMMRGMHADGMHRRVERLHRMAADLELTEDQRTKMRDIADRQQRQTIKARADMDIARMDLHALMREDEADLNKINAQIDRIAKMRADMEKSRASTRVQMRSVLTPEQKQKLKETRSGSRKMRSPTPTPSEGGDT